MAIDQATEAGLGGRLGCGEEGEEVVGATNYRSSWGPRVKPREWTERLEWGTEHTSRGETGEMELQPMREAGLRPGGLLEVA